jgi:hypothetical protein
MAMKRILGFAIRGTNAPDLALSVHPTQIMSNIRVSFTTRKSASVLFPAVYSRERSYSRRLLEAWHRRNESLA